MKRIKFPPPYEHPPLKKTYYVDPHPVREPETRWHLPKAGAFEMRPFGRRGRPR